MEKIYGAIIGVMSEIGAVGKDKTNNQQGFKYRGIDDVMNALQPALVNNKIFIIPAVLEEMRQERQTSKGGTLFYTRLKIEYKFCAEDGSSITSTVIGEAMDSGDKATNKAMSIAFKYACFQVFCIPTEEMKDPDAECHEIKPQQKPSPSQTPITAQQIEEIKKKIVDKEIQEKAVLDSYKITKFEEMTLAQFTSAMRRLDL